MDFSREYDVVVAGGGQLRCTEMGPPGFAVGQLVEGYAHGLLV